MIDTADKRSSAIHVSLPWRMMLPLPGVLDAGDRLHVVFFYRGIAAGAAAVLVYGTPRVVAQHVYHPGAQAQRIAES